MKNYYCTELRKNRNPDTIQWEYVGGSDGVPTKARISIGDTDPLTGEPITDITWFREYNRMANTQVEQNLRYMHPETEKVEIAAKKRMQEKKEIRENFSAEYGYEPDQSTVTMLYYERHPEKMLISTDYVIQDDEEGDSTDLSSFIGKAPEMEPESDAVDKMREYAEGLNPRQKDIYRAMLLKYQGGGIWIRDKELAEKWGVSVTVIRKEKNRIMEGIRKTVKSVNFL